jgi:7-carboxy-7-deazaguanine synthase
MARLFLSEDGVFPIVKDANGKLICEQTEADMQIAGTIQGEGKLIGVPSLFVRLAGCNLRCKWTLPDGKISTCDTSYANDDTGVSTWHEVEEVVDIVYQNLGNIKHLVITGGEPLLQKDSLIEFCQLLKARLDIHITIETNGTIVPGELAQYIDLFSVSPKLGNALMVKSGQMPLYKVQSFIDFVRKDANKDIQIKFVVADSSEEEKIKSLLAELTCWNDNDIMIMPAGTTNEMLHNTSKPALEISVKNGWRFTSRLHITLFGDKRKV